jgi:ribosome-associated heat shock protein Hsp15
MIDALSSEGQLGGARPKIRLDKWLWHARFVKTRSLAAKFCAEGGIRVDGALIDKPSQMVRPGQVLTFVLARHVRVIELVAIGLRRGPAEEARTLYRDLSPPAPETAIPRDIPF